MKRIISKFVAILLSLAVATPIMTVYAFASNAKVEISENTIIDKCHSGLYNLK